MTERGFAEQKKENENESGKLILGLECNLGLPRGGLSRSNFGPGTVGPYFCILKNH